MSNLDRSRLEGAPAYTASEMSVWDDLRGRDRGVVPRRVELAFYNDVCERRTLSGRGNRDTHRWLMGLPSWVDAYAKSYREAGVEAGVDGVDGPC